MFEIERIVAIVKPTKKMLDFMQSLPNAKEELSLSQLRHDCTTLLIPAFKNPKQAIQFIERHYTGIFDNELQSWDVPDALWPAQRTLSKFHDWFDIEFHSLVYDISEFDHLTETP